MIVSLPYHVIHQLANINARGENWRKRKREEVLTFSCSRQGVGDGQIEMSWTDFILSLILIHLCLSSPNVCSSSNDQLGFIWADIDCRRSSLQKWWAPSSPHPFLCLLKLTCRGNSLSSPFGQTDDRCQQLRRKSSRRIWDVMFCLKAQIGRLRCATMSVSYGGGVHSDSRLKHSSTIMLDALKCAQRCGQSMLRASPVFNVTSVRMVGGPALTAAPPPPTPVKLALCLHECGLPQDKGPVFSALHKAFSQTFGQTVRWWLRWLWGITRR